MVQTLALRDLAVQCPAAFRTLSAPERQKINAGVVGFGLYKWGGRPQDFGADLAGHPHTWDPEGGEWDPT